MHPFTIACGHIRARVARSHRGIFSQDVPSVVSCGTFTGA